MIRKRCCLFIALTCFAIAFFAVRGCAYGQEFVVKPHCVPEAIYCAWGWKAQWGDEVRVALSKTDFGGHAQAQAYNLGKWTYLTTGYDPKKGTVCKIADRHFDVEPYRYVDLRTFTTEQLDFNNIEMGIQRTAK
jgi:hypothetical protein